MNKQQIEKDFRELTRLFFEFSKEPMTESYVNNIYALHAKELWKGRSEDVINIHSQLGVTLPDIELWVKDEMNKLINKLPL